MLNYLAIALGGAVGAISRYGLMNLIHSAHFPLGTLLVNILGSFILGTFLELNALKFSVTEEVRALIVIGFCGAFTTFSTFSMDTVYLLQKGEILKVAAYISLSVFLAIGAFWAGMAFIRQISHVI